MSRIVHEGVSEWVWLMMRVVKAARAIRWNDIGTIDYMEGSDIYVDLRRLSDALDELAEVEEKHHGTQKT